MDLYVVAMVMGWLRPQAARAPGNPRSRWSAAGAFLVLAFAPVVVLAALVVLTHRFGGLGL